MSANVVENGTWMTKDKRGDKKDAYLKHKIET